MRYILLAFGILLFATCRKPLAVTDTTVPRVKEQISVFQNVLTSSEGGWLAHLESPSGARYNFWMAFDAEGRVTMTGDLNESAQKELQSAYQIKQLQQPTLIFETYNHLSVLADPDLNGGRTHRIDIQYAFTGSLADSLKTLKDLNNIERFEMRGRLHRTKATFYRANLLRRRTKQNIIRIFKTGQAIEKMAAGSTINPNSSTKDTFYHTMRVLQMGNKEWHYNFQPTRGKGNIYDRIFAFTDMKAQKGVPMTYYFDIDGRMHFITAPKAIKTLLPRDQAMANEIKDWVLTFPEDIANHTTKLTFTKTNNEGTQRETGVLTTKLFSEMSYKPTGADSALWANRAKLELNGWLFAGMEKMLQKDATNLRRSLLMIDFPYFKQALGIEPSYVFITSDLQKIPGGFIRYNYRILGDLGLIVIMSGAFYMDPSHNSYMLPLAKGLGYTEGTPPIVTLKNRNGALLYFIYPVCLGFEWHSGNGNMLPFFAR